MKNLNFEHFGKSTLETNFLRNEHLNQHCVNFVNFDEKLELYEHFGKSTLETNFLRNDHLKPTFCETMMNFE